MSVIDWVRRRMGRADGRSLWQWLTEGKHDEAVMPAHYSSLVQPERGHYPGHCPNCQTDNEPGYTFCESCGRRLPNSDDFGRDRDLSAIVDD